MVVSMTENDPNAHEDSGVHASSATGEQTGWSAAESGQAGQPEPSTPPRGTTLGAGQPYGPPNPWSPHAQQAATAYGQHVQPARAAQTADNSNHLDLVYNPTRRSDGLVSSVRHIASASAPYIAVRTAPVTIG